LVAGTGVRDLLDRAKHLFVAANRLKSSRSRHTRALHAAHAKCRVAEHRALFRVRADAPRAHNLLRSSISGHLAEAVRSGRMKLSAALIGYGSDREEQASSIAQEKRGRLVGVA
jgi:hypothetical protein